MSFCYYYIIGGDGLKGKKWAPEISILGYCGSDYWFCLSICLKVALSFLSLRWDNFTCRDSLSVDLPSCSTLRGDSWAYAHVQVLVILHSACTGVPFKNPIFAQKVQNLLELVLAQPGCWVCDSVINGLLNSQNDVSCSVRYLYYHFSFLNGWNWVFHWVKCWMPRLPPSTTWAINASVILE